MADPSPPLTWISKRDGRLVTFDPDVISRDLFAATQRLGPPDAFLARELTDGVLHFLAVETENGTVTSAQVSETVSKVVRELGQVALSQAFVQCLEEKTATTTDPVAARPQLQAWEHIKGLVEAAP